MKHWTFEIKEFDSGEIYSTAIDEKNERQINLNVKGGKTIC